MSNTNELNRNKIYFAIVNNKFVHTMFDKRDHKDWLEETYDIKGKEYEDTILGYMVDGKVYFYRSSDFKPININNIGIDALNHIHILSKVYMKTHNPRCFNGVHGGLKETVWIPIPDLEGIRNLLEDRLKNHNVTYEI